MTGTIVLVVATSTGATTGIEILPPAELVCGAGVDTGTGVEAGAGG